jgi:flagellin
MALVINTNVSSLTAQRALAESSAELETAMERLSTGSKINSAADDAAGLAMTQRMTAQVRGLAMAVKNANDGQALTQSIEGALGEVSDMLQRMRELALQAANGTNSSADRTFLQSEVNLLIQEISRVSASTRYNGELILDGTFLNKALQVGIEEGENIIFSVDSVAAENVGAHTLVGEGVGARAAQADPLANPTTEADDIEIFGYLGTKSTAASPGDSAKQTAVKVNNLTGDTGVKAYAKTYASIESTSAEQKTYSVKINGFTTGNFVISSGDVESAVDAINQVSGSTGVTASSSNNKIVLFDSDGDDITVENLQTLSGFSDLRVSKLGEDGLVSNVVGSAIDLGVSGGSDSTRVTGTLKLVSANPFSLDQKAATRASGILLNDTSIADGNTTLTFDPGHGLAVGASFTIAGETDGPTHYVTGVSGNDITFIPALVNGHGVQNDDAITIGTETPGYYADGSSTATLKDLTQIRVNTAVSAGDSISIIDAALDKVAQMRSDLGAIENRLSYTVSNLMNIAEKTADARSRLDDADFALESARLAKAQVVQQAGTQMLAQANQMTQLVLDLLR